VNRTVYWIVCGCVAASLLVGYTLGAPEGMEISGRQWRDAIVAQMQLAAVVAAVITIVRLYLVPSSVRHQPAQRGGDYDTSVLWYGCSTAAAAWIFAIVVAIVAATFTPLGPLSRSERVGLLILNAPGFLSLLIAILVAMIVFGIGTRLRGEWGGKFAAIGTRSRVES
jgi:uncharacterized membrane protein YhaH (DUF805 family)